MPRRFRTLVSPRPQKLPTHSVFVTASITAALFLLIFRFDTAAQSVLPLLSLSHVRISEPQSPTIPNTHQAVPTRCILYDRPPRTASTTIGSALTSCLYRHGYVQPPQPPTEQRPLLVPSMLALPGHRKALLSRHLYLNATSVNMLRDNCHMILYISSCAPLKRRLWSAVKYSIAGGHGNASLSEPQMQKALKIAKKSKRQLQFLRAYPYVDKHKQPLHVYDALIPDYVIRVDHLRSDLSKLLEAFACDTAYQSGNVHQTSLHDQQLLHSLHVGDDKIYTRLMQLAEQKNQMGLLKASVFVKDP